MKFLSLKIKKIFFPVLIIIIIPGFTYSQHNDKPKLIVGIVVDQMRYDYIYRFWNKFSENGFKKLVNKGFFCKNANIDYFPSYTAPGHASIYTGTYPSVHGIVSNEWYDRKRNKLVYACEDSTVESVGTTGIEGLMSPANLLATTITDELRIATNMKSRVIGVSLKDRASIFPAGHLGTAYWFDYKTESFISSTYYVNSLPPWLQEFNKTITQKYFSSVWQTYLPIEKYTESIPDDINFEAKFEGDLSRVFPYDIPFLRDKNPDVSLDNPFSNTLLKDFCLAAIENESLGKNSVPDMLAVSFSATDYIGHMFGPNSIEIEDTYIRLDLDIADLIQKLESKFDADNLLFFLTADHGVALIPDYLKELKIPAGVVISKAYNDSLNSFLSSIHGPGQWSLYFLDQQIYFNHRLIDDNKINFDEIENESINYLQNMNGISSVLSSENLARYNYSSGPGKYIQRGFYQKRSGDLFITFDVNWIDDKLKGTTHGSIYNYDTHVPLLWYGWKIKHGESFAPVFITDIAPTISSFLDISFPGGCIGNPILFLK